MFEKASSFNQDLSLWDVSSATDIEGMFSDPTAFNRNLCQWRSKLTVPVNYNFNGIFDFTSCPLAKDPEYVGTTIQNMCYSCV
jgi:surface protein